MLKPVALKFTLEKKPMPPAPCPRMEFVAVMLPVVVKVAPTLIPLLPPVPPVQVENTTGAAPVNAPPKFTPWLAPVLPPVQLEKVISPVVPGVQAILINTPCEPLAVAELAPLIVIGPDVLVIPFTAIKKADELALPEAAAVRFIAPCTVEMDPPAI